MLVTIPTNSVHQAPACLRAFYPRSRHSPTPTPAESPSSYIPYLSFCRTHDVLRVEGQQRLVILELGLVVRRSGQQLPELLAVSVDRSCARCSGNRIGSHEVIGRRHFSKHVSNSDGRGVWYTKRSLTCSSLTQHDPTYITIHMGGRNKKSGTERKEKRHDLRKTGTLVVRLALPPPRDSALGLPPTHAWGENQTRKQNFAHGINRRAQASRHAPEHF